MSKRNRKNHDLYEDIENIKAALRVASDDVKEKASDLFCESLENAEGRADALKETMCDYIEDQPLKSLGIAALVGLAIGVYLTK